MKNGEKRKDVEIERIFRKIYLFDLRAAVKSALFYFSNAFGKHHLAKLGAAAECALPYHGNALGKKNFFNFCAGKSHIPYFRHVIGDSDLFFLAVIT